jgi:hypothetical protein
MVMRECQHRVNDCAMEREIIWRELYGGLWHTTRPDRFAGILESGAILPNPDIPEKERWGTAIGEEGYPYVRTLNGVSLFDFYQFDRQSYDEKYPGSSLYYFVPCQLQWDSAVWIEVDREKIGPDFLSAIELMEKWKSGNSCRRFMAEIEAAYLGPVPVSVFKRAFRVSKEDSQLIPLSLTRS